VTPIDASEPVDRNFRSPAEKRIAARNAEIVHELKSAERAQREIAALQMEILKQAPIEFREEVNTVLKGIYIDGQRYGYHSEDPNSQELRPMVHFTSKDSRNGTEKISSQVGVILGDWGRIEEQLMLVMADGSCYRLKSGEYHNDNYDLAESSVPDPRLDNQRFPLVDGIYERNQYQNSPTISIHLDESATTSDTTVLIRSEDQQTPHHLSIKTKLMLPQRIWGSTQQISAKELKSMADTLREALYESTPVVPLPRTE